MTADESAVGLLRSLKGVPPHASALDCTTRRPHIEPCLVGLPARAHPSFPQVAHPSSAGVSRKCRHIQDPCAASFRPTTPADTFVNRRLHRARATYPIPLSTI